MKFKLQTPRGKYTFEAEDSKDGVLINPKLPSNFDMTANDARPAGHTKFWEMPFIVTETAEKIEAWLDAATDEYAEKRREDWNATRRAGWFKAWPSGTRFTVRCLDGGAWDRSTNWGSVSTLTEALKIAERGPEWRQVRQELSQSNPSTAPAVDTPPPAAAPAPEPSCTPAQDQAERARLDFEEKWMGLPEATPADRKVGGKVIAQLGDRVVIDMGRGRNVLGPAPTTKEQDAGKGQGRGG